MPPIRLLRHRCALTIMACILLNAPAALSASPTAKPPSATSQTALQADGGLWVGAAWYPEQWPESRWDADLALMARAGANVVRMGEFAWARIEPDEGRFDLDWIERAIRAAHRHGLKVVMSTPTDTPPNWLLTRYPDTRRIASDGRAVRLGGRREFSISSPRYRDLCRRIVARLAARFGHDPDVIGWQVGNEFTDESYDPSAMAAWQGWLKQRYGSLDALNAAWTTQYWSQVYSDWAQVPFDDQPGNPGLMMERKRFITDQWLGFQQAQIEALRGAIDPRQFVTTNLGGLGWADRFDRAAISAPYDLISWDDYVGQGHLQPWRNGATHDLARGWKQRNFWVMEAQPGSVNWAPVNTTLARGETRAMAFQALGHGADAVLYWQWRSALNGQEQLHGAIVGPDGEPLPFYQEFAEIGRDFARAAPVLKDTAVRSQVAFLHDYPSRWAVDFQPHSRDYDPVGLMVDMVRPFQQKLGAVDIVAPDADWSRYRLIVAPSLMVLPDALAKRLLAWVAQGGQLVLGPRSGQKDEANRLHVQRQPGPLAEALGGRVEQFYALDTGVKVPLTGAEAGATAAIWAEHLAPRAPDARVTLRYGKADGWLDGQAAGLERPYGKGTIAYLGTIPDGATWAAMAGQTIERAGLHPAFPVPDGVERMVREGVRGRAYIVVNHGAAAQTVALPHAMRDALSGTVQTSLVLAPQGVAVLTEGSSK